MKFNAPNASRKSMRNFRMVFITSLTIALVFLATSSALMAPLSGAIFTTDSLCAGTNVNIFDSKAAVHLNGGPAHPGSAGLPDGEYYVQVTEPDGTLLGTSVGTTDETPLVISGGEFVTCYQLQAILRKASNAGPYPVAPDGYDTTSNGGGVVQSLGEHRKLLYQQRRARPITLRSRKTAGPFRRTPSCASENSTTPTPTGLWTLASCCSMAGSSAYRMASTSFASRPLT